MLVYTQAQLTTLNAEVQRYKERNSNNENNVSKLNTELSDAKQVTVAVDVSLMYHSITSLVASSYTIQHKIEIFW